MDHRNILLPLEEMERWYADKHFTLSLVGHFMLLWRRYTLLHKLDSQNAKQRSRKRANPNASLNYVNLQNSVSSHQKELHTWNFSPRQLRKRLASFLFLHSQRHEASFISSSRLFHPAVATSCSDPWAWLVHPVLAINTHLHELSRSLISPRVMPNRTTMKSV